MEAVLQGDEHDPCSDDRNAFTFFRRTFERRGGSVPAADEAGEIEWFISAGGRYQLYLNGELLGRGPGRSHPEFQHVDRYTVTELLKPGRNVIAVLVHSYGADTAWYVRPPQLERETFGCGGFLFQGEQNELQHSERGGAIGLDTGTGKWRAIRSTAWNRDTVLLGPGFAEELDLPALPREWTSAAFDDTHWQVPIVQTATLRLGGTTYHPFPRLVEPDAARVIDRQPRAPVELRRAESDAATVSYIADFGATEIGRLTFTAEAEEETTVTLSYSERLAPDGTLLLPAEVPGISHPPIHTITLAAAENRFCQFEASGFRYAELRIPAAGTKLTAFEVVPQRYPAEDTGSFGCSDAELDEVWRACERSVVLCRQDGLIDCPAREQRQWTGDAYGQALFGYMLSRDPGPAERMLRQVAQTQRGDGMVMMASVCDLSAAGKLYIPDFALWWVLAFEQHLLYIGRREILIELLPTAVRVLRWFLPFINGDSLLSEVPGWTFIDWSMELDRDGASAALNAFFVAAIRSLVRVARELRSEEILGEFPAVAEQVADAVNVHLYDEDRGAYVDSLHSDGSPSRVISQQTNAAMIAWRIAPRSRWAPILEIITDPERVTLTRAWRADIERPFDPETQVVMAQPYLARLLHQAIRNTGRAGDLPVSIRDRWLPMARRNGTIWEHWQDTPSTSFCHAFSCTPIFDLPSYVAGIEPTAPGFAKCVFRPALGELEYAAATVPTPAGDISVRWERREAGLRLYADIPSQTEALVVTPGLVGPTMLRAGEEVVDYVRKEER